MKKATKKEIEGNITLTEADQRTIKVLPEGWFEPYELSSSIRCPEYRCQRLERADILESRVEGKHGSLYWVYRKKE